MLGFLHTHRVDRGEPPAVHIEVPDGGTTARDIARSLGLPLERIDGEFINHRSADLDAAVLPGDRVAFVPLGTPASHPAFFGPFVVHGGSTG
jgi:hypothetical protein